MLASVGQSTRLAELVQERINTFVASKRADLEPLGESIEDLLTAASDFLSGGKRIRAYCISLGFTACRELNLTSPLNNDAARVVNAAAALELFHAAALVHDDVIDRSETRRGKPSVHTNFARKHSRSGWRGQAAHFGVAAAILLGDLLQSWADELFQKAVDSSEPAAGSRARGHFNRMRTEVAFGQYFDVLEEQQTTFAPHAEQMERATRVLLYKSAKYSVEEPLLIGAALAGASTELEKTLSGFGVPAGVAFQLRDDVLGVFGNSAVTGKPSGDDLIEGKRTVLVTLTRKELNTSLRAIFDDVFGDAEMTSLQLEMLQRTIRETGALDQVEELIAKNMRLAQRFARSPEVAPAAVEKLVSLAESMAKRQA